MATTKRKPRRRRKPAPPTLNRNCLVCGRFIGLERAKLHSGGLWAYHEASQIRKGGSRADAETTRRAG